MQKAPATLELPSLTIQSSGAKMPQAPRLVNSPLTSEASTALPVINTRNLFSRLVFFLLQQQDLHVTQIFDSSNPSTQLAIPMRGRDHTPTIKPSSRGPLVRLP